MRIVFFGTPDFAVPCLRALLASGRHEVVAVVTQPDKPKGRGMEMVPPPVKEVAAAAGIPVLQPASVRKPPFAPELARFAPDVAVVVAYGKILPSEVLAVPRLGCVNVHGSLLPRWRGAAPIQWAVIAGDAVSGVCTMQMDEGMDTGDVLLRREVPLDPHETAGSLFERLAPLGAELLLETLDRLEALPREKQDPSKATHARMLEKSDGRIDWSKSAREIDCHVRGMSPWPGAFTELAGGKILKVHRVEVSSEDGAAAAAGTVEHGKDAVDVVAGRGRVRLLDVQGEGGKRMSAVEFWRGKGAGVTRLGAGA